MKETNGRHGSKSVASFAMAAILAASSMMSVPVYADMDELETIIYDSEELIAEVDDVNEITAAEPTLDLESKTYKKGRDGFTVKVTLNGNTFTGITKDYVSPLEEGKDYIVTENGDDTIDVKINDCAFNLLDEGDFEDPFGDDEGDFDDPFALSEISSEEEFYPIISLTFEFEGDVNVTLDVAVDYNESTVAKPTLDLESKTYKKGGDGFTVKVTLNGNTFIGITKDYVSPLEEGKDYIVTENGDDTIDVKINDCAFNLLDENDFEDPFALSEIGSEEEFYPIISLTFEFEGDVNVTLDVAVDYNESTVAKPTLDLESKTYKKGGDGFTVKVTLNGNTFIGITRDWSQLEEGKDYTVTENGDDTIDVKINDCAFDIIVDEGDIEDPFGDDEDGTEDPFALSEIGSEEEFYPTTTLIFEFEGDVNVTLDVAVDYTEGDETDKVNFILAEREADSYKEDDTEANDGKDGAIVVASASKDAPLTNFTAVSFKIANDADTGYNAIEYDIVPADGYALLYHEETEIYEINVKPEKGNKSPAVSEEPAQGGIVIGYLKYPGGYGKGTISASNIRITTETSDNLYKEFTANEIWNFEYEVREKTQELTVNVAFNLPTETKHEAAYEQMELNVYSGRLGDITFALGNDVTVLSDEDVEAGVVGVRSVTVEDNKYTVIVTNLPAFDKYTVSIKGDGYRSAKTSLNLNENKTVLFWNNVKDADAVYVKNDKDVTEKTINKNFLAGDIIMDGKIDLYDLSAISSYFGKGIGTDGLMTADVEANADYIQYDLNRDGKIDILDITMVIDGWAE